MKRIIAILLAMLMLFSLAACGSSEEQTPSETPAAGSPSPSPDIADPSDDPSNEPSAEPSEEVSTEPSADPSEEPSDEPSAAPSDNPSTAPSVAPSTAPSAKPSVTPSTAPSPDCTTPVPPTPSPAPASPSPETNELKLCPYHEVEDDCWAHDGILCYVHEDYDDCWEHSGFCWCDEHQSYDDCHHGGVHFVKESRCYVHNNYDDCYLHDGYYCAEHKTYDDCIVPAPVIPENDSKALAFWEDMYDKYADNMPMLMELDEQSVADTYGLDMSLVDDFYAAMPVISMNIEEVFIAHVTGDMDTVKAACEARQQTLAGGFLYPSGVELVDDYKIATCGDWIIFIIHTNAEDIVADFQTAFAE